MEAISLSVSVSYFYILLEANIIIIIAELPLIYRYKTLGVAYILKLLDQYKQFDSLHWFEEVRTRYTEEQKKVQATVSKQQKEDQQTAVLTVQKLRSYQMEFELLRFSFDGARIFFKD